MAPARRSPASGGSSPPAASSPAAAQAAQELLRPVRGGPAQRTLEADITHWPLADGTDIEICNWLDDHSRYCLASTAALVFTAPAIDRLFRRIAAAHGDPAGVLTDNGAVFTGRYRGHGRVALEVTLHAHIGVGRRHAGTPVIVLVHDLHIRVLSTSGELLRDLTLDPTRDYQPQAQT